MRTRGFEGSNDVTTVTSLEPKKKFDSCGGQPSRTLTIVILGGKQVLGVYAPSENVISIGRSRSNTMIIDDPAFPRYIGDVILSPEPLFRHRGGNEGSPKVHKLISRRAIRVGSHFKLYYLEEGDSLRNRRTRTGFLRGALLSMSLITLLITGYKVHVMSKSVVSTESRNTLSENGKEKHDTGRDFDETTPLMKTAHENEILEEEPKRNDMTRQTFEAIRLDREIDEVSVKITSHKKQTQGSKISEKIFSASLEATASLIKEGDLVRAGRTINPIFENLDTKQKTELVQRLDHYLYKIFREAYLMYPFDREKAKEILVRVVMSDLHMMPSYSKALQLLSATRTNHNNP